MEYDRITTIRRVRTVKKFARKTLAFMLALALVLSLVPGIAFAAETKHTGKWTYYPGSYSWISGSFQSADDDLVFENDQPYDWKVLITPSKKPPASAQVQATIQDAQGNTISSCNITVNGLAQHKDGVLCTAADFPQLTTTLPGTFTLTLSLISKGTTYATLEQTFSRVIDSATQVTLFSRSSPSFSFSVSDPIDLVLNIKNTDGIAESLLAAITVTGSFSEELLAAQGVILPAETNTSLILKNLVNIPAITTPGIYQINLTLTDTAGVLRQKAVFSFTVTALDPVNVQFTSDLSVGFGRVDISPTESVPLRGYGYSSGRMSNKIQDPLYATCIALTDSSDNTVLLFTVDLTNAYTEVMDTARLQISQRTGIPVDAIMVSCTHTHSAPDLLNENEPSIPRYIEAFSGWMVEAAVAALEDRAPAKVYTASTATKNLNFVRRYLLADGTYAGDNFGHINDSPIVGHETDADNELQLVRLERYGAKDIILANFQTHPHKVGKTTAVTADLIAPFRTKVEDALGCYVAYFTGSSGNVNHSSRIQSENIVRTYTEHGYALADYVLQAYDSFQEVSVSSVKLTKTVLLGKVDHSMDAVASKCKEAVDYYLANGNYKPYSYLLDQGVRSIYHANAIAIRSAMPELQELELYAVSLGDLAFVTVPFEMFDTNGMEIKDGSPFSTTFVLTCANNNFNYLPSKLAWQHGGYEVDAALFQCGTAEELVENYLAMLDTLYQMP